MTDLLYQKSVNQIRVPVVDDITGEAISASSFTNAEYVIYNANREVRLKLSLGSGIEVENNDFLITIPFAQLSFNGEVQFWHQLRVWNSESLPLPPLFSNPLKIFGVI